MKKQKRELQEKGTNLNQLKQRQKREEKKNKTKNGPIIVIIGC